MEPRHHDPPDARGVGYRAASDRPFELTGGSLCLDFANTVESRPTDHPRELLADYRRLVDWSRQAGVVSPPLARRLLSAAEARPRRARAALRRARALRELLFQAFAGHARGARVAQDALEALNGIVSPALARLRLAQDAEGFRWDWDDEEALDRMLWPVARSAVALLTSDRLGQVRVCAADDCDWLFLDASRNGSRRWCDMRGCGNRSKARRYRAAHR